MNIILSKTICFIRFPLMVGVVLIHSVINDVVVDGSPIINYAGNIYKILSILFSQIISSTAVPLFFFISGFLFFFNIDKFNFAFYKKKIYSRFFSLFIPYICWNVIILIILFIKDSFLDQFSSGRYLPIYCYGWREFFYAFWNHDDIGLPICPQFWFIRDLMVILFFLSPVIYFLTKKLKTVFVFIMFLYWFCWGEYVLQLSPAALFFVSFGAYFGINNKDFLAPLNKFKHYIIPIYILMISVELLIRIENLDLYMELLHKINIVWGMVSALYISMFFVKRSIVIPKILSKSTFFLYGSHVIIIAIVQKLFSKLFLITTDIEITFLYLISAVVTILVSTVIYFISSSLFPNFTRVICGDRS